MVDSASTVWRDDSATQRVHRIDPDGIHRFVFDETGLPDEGTWNLIKYRGELPSAVTMTVTGPGGTATCDYSVVARDAVTCQINATPPVVNVDQPFNVSVTAQTVDGAPIDTVSALWFEGSSILDPNTVYTRPRWNDSRQPVQNFSSQPWLGFSGWTGLVKQAFDKSSRLRVTVVSGDGTGVCEATIRLNEPSIPSEIVSPAPGTTFHESVQRFFVAPGSNVGQTLIRVGTTLGGSEILPDTSPVPWLDVPGLPIDGTPIHVRLTSIYNTGGSAYNDISYPTAGPQVRDDGCIIVNNHPFFTRQGVDGQHAPVGQARRYCFEFLGERSTLQVSVANQTRAGGPCEGFSGSVIPPEGSGHPVRSFSRTTLEGLVNYTDASPGWWELQVTGTDDPACNLYAVSWFVGECTTDCYSTGPLRYFPLLPHTVLDTQEGLPMRDTETVFRVAGMNGVPVDARAVAVRGSIVGPITDGAIFAMPGDELSAPYDLQRFIAGDQLTFSGVVRLPDDYSGKIRVLLEGESHVTLEVEGYYR